MSNTNTVATKSEKDIKEIVIVKRWLCNKLIENGFHIKYVKADRDNPQRTVFVFVYTKKLASVKDGLILEHLDEVDKTKKKDMQVVTMSVDDVENVVRKVVKEEIQK